jgi:hypothetical protein
VKDPKRKDPVPLAVHVMLDCSGSMQHRHKLAVKAANAFIAGLAQSLVPASITMSRYNNSLSVMIDNALIYDLPVVTEETYRITGGTSTYYCTHEAIKHLDEIAADTKIVVIFTDGMSNAAGREDAIKAIRQKQGEGWLFMFVAMTPKERGHIEEMERLARAMLIEKGHLVVIRPEQLVETLTKAALCCLDFKGTGKAKL